MRYWGIDAFKHLLALAVIYLHLSSHSRYDDQTNAFLLKTDDFVDGAVFGFFFISGYFFRGLPNLSAQEVIKFFKKSFIRLLVPFFCFSLIYTFALAALGKQSFYDGIFKTISLHGASMQLYFLPFLFLVSCLFHIYAAALTRFGFLNAPWDVLLLLVLFALSQVFKTTSSTGSDLQLLFLYGACFVLGRLTASFYSKRSTFLMYVTVAISVIVGMALIDKRFWDVLAVIVLFLIALRISFRPISPNLSFSGSGGVYLLHAPIVIYLISTLLLRVKIHEMSNAIATLILTYLICLAATKWFLSRFPKYGFLLLE